MTDREKVIKALECRLDINGSKYKHCLNCDYRHDIDHCQWACQTDGILEDALALLKAQEPRVLALGEIHRGMAVWLEDVDKADAILAIGGSSAGGAKCFITENDMSIAPKDAEYDIRWRAWTQEPTEEQRRAVKWDAQEQRDYEAAVEMAEYCERYEPTYNADDGSM